MWKSLLIFLLFAFIGTVEFYAEETKKHELGIVDYKGYYVNKPHQKKIISHTKQLLIYFEKMGYKGQLINVHDLNDVSFLSRFKRILIPYKTVGFTAKAYETMEQYIKSGGLLIANSVLLGTDTNEDYTFNHHQEDKTFHKRVGCPMIGIAGRYTGHLSSMTHINDSPLTLGLEQETIKFEKKILAWFPVNHSAVILAEGKGTRKDRSYNKIPLLAFKHQGKGACIFFGFLLPSNNKTVNQIVKNLMSEKTLEWQVDTVK